MKKSLLALTLAGSIALSGCFGSFGLTKKVKSIGDGIGNVIVKEIVFFVLTFPVGGPCIFFDWLIFNTLEYWTGTKVFASGDTHYESDAEGNSVTAVKMEDGSLYMQLTTKDGATQELVLQKDEEIVRILDTQGNVLRQAAYAAE